MCLSVCLSVIVKLPFLMLTACRGREREREGGEGERDCEEREGEGIRERKN